MGSYYPQPENHNHVLEEQLKVLEEDELLDFWEESQFMGAYMANDQEAQLINKSAPEYERLILQELHVRAVTRPVIPKPISL